ncbi:MAG: glycosyltransferase, partial [Geminicoccales bacterium]
ADVLVHPSLHESGGLVCLEAMAARRPVLCLDWGGPAVQVADGTGIRVPVRDTAQVVSELAAAMQRLAGSAALRDELGRKGREYVEAKYCWPGKVAFYRSLYAEAVQRAKRERANA